MAEKFVFSVTPYWLFVLGTLIGEIKNGLTQGSTCYEPVRECLGVLSVYKGTKDYELNTKHFEFIAKEADGLLSDLSEKYTQENADLDSKDRETLKLAITRWETRLKEISRNWVLYYPDTYIDADKLGQGAQSFLSDDEFNMLNPTEQQSLNEAISSLLVANVTSAEFMALRTAEGLLKRWYERKKSTKLGKTTWGEVLEKLSLEFPKKAERPKELLLLDYLRERRNEIAHPDAVSNSIQASTTFFNVISLCQTLQSK